MPPDQLPGRYQASDVYLSCSKRVEREHQGYKYIHTETMGRSICEAQANGLPVVATDVGGCSEIMLAGESGCLLPEGDVQQIAKAVDELLSDKDKADMMASKGRAYASRELEWNNIFAKYLDVLMAQG